MPGMDEPIWYGVFAPKDTPATIVQGVAAAVREAVKGDEVRRLSPPWLRRDRQLAGRVRDDGRQRRRSARSSTLPGAARARAVATPTASVGAGQAPDFLRVAPR